LSAGSACTGGVSGLAELPEEAGASGLSAGLGCAEGAEGSACSGSVFSGAPPAEVSGTAGVTEGASSEELPEGSVSAGEEPSGVSAGGASGEDGAAGTSAEGTSTAGVSLGGISVEELSETGSEPEGAELPAPEALPAAGEPQLVSREHDRQITSRSERIRRILSTFFQIRARMHDKIIIDGYIVAKKIQKRKKKITVTKTFC